MKILYVSGGGDYTASAFEEEFNQVPVSKLLDEIDSGDLKLESEMVLDGELYDVWFKVIDLPQTPSKEFLSFIRDEIQDYDQTKHSNFYLENEIING